MKLHASSSSIRQQASRIQSQRGSAVIIIMGLIALILIYVAANVRTLTNLGRELRLLERQQTMRLQHLAPKARAPGETAVTNQLPAVVAKPAAP